MTCNGQLSASSSSSSVWTPVLAAMLLSAGHMVQHPCQRCSVRASSLTGGTNYIQAAPDGPSAWVASSIVERVRPHCADSKRAQTVATRPPLRCQALDLPLSPTGSHVLPSDVSRLICECSPNTEIKPGLKQTARWSESPGDLERYGIDQAHVLAELVFDQDMLNDLLISTSLGVSVAPLAMRGSNMSSTPGVSAGTHTCGSTHTTVCLCFASPHVILLLRAIHLCLLWHYTTAAHEQGLS